MNILKDNKTIWHVVSGIILVVILCLIVFLMWFSGYNKTRADSKVLKSRYTYSVDVDAYGNVVDRNSQYTTSTSAESKDFSGLNLENMADIWIRNFLNQFTVSYLSLSKSLKKIQIDNITVLDEDSKTVLISFAAQLRDQTSEYFSSWNGILDNGLCPLILKIMMMEQLQYM